MNSLFSTFSIGLAALMGGSLLPAILIGAAGVFIIKAIMKVLQSLLDKSRLEKAAHSLILSVARVVLYVLLALIVAAKLGVDVSGIIALASVLTLAVSLAVQNLLANVFGGFTLLYTKPFASEDYVEIKDAINLREEIQWCLEKKYYRSCKWCGNQKAEEILAGEQV